MSDPQALRRDLLAKMSLMQTSEVEEAEAPPLSPEELQERRYQQLAATNEFLANEIEQGTPQTEEQKKLSQKHFGEFSKALDP